MNQNQESFKTSVPQNESGSAKEAAPKKSFSFLSFLFTLLIVLAIITGCYLAFFPNKKIELPFLSKDVENKINSYIENPAKIFEAENTPAPEKQNENANRSAYEKASEIFQKITEPEPAQPTETVNPEDNLTEHDMATQQETAPAASESSTNVSGTFSLEPPSTMSPLESGRRMLTEEEIAEAQEQDRQSKLEKLNELRNEQSTAVHDTNNLLPTKVGELSQTIPDSSLDPVVTLFFIQDLADYLVNNYHTNGRTAVSMPRLNQRYGVGLTGLEHASGRTGVLEYAYNANMIPVLYKHLSPVLINAMQLATAKKNMPAAEQEKMFKTYASQSRMYAGAIRSLINVPQLSENIHNLVAIEKDLKKEENSFAENLLNFEQNRDDKALARTYEAKVKQSTVRSAQLKTRVNNVKNDLRQYLVRYDNNLANVPNCLELALWLDRRNNAPASVAFADALDSFASDVSALFHE